MSTHDLSYDTDVATILEKKLQEPSFYKVVLLNDDFTPMNFVVDLIVMFFKKSVEDATQIMLNIHHQGVGVCGVYPREIAETKVLQVNNFSRKNGHPLKCRMERE